MEIVLTLDEHHDATGRLELGDHLLQTLGPDDLCAFGFVGQELVHLFGGAIVGAHHEAVVVHVEDQILAHHGQSDQCNISPAHTQLQLVKFQHSVNFSHSRHSRLKFIAFRASTNIFLVQGFTTIFELGSDFYLALERNQQKKLLRLQRALTLCRIIVTKHVGNNFTLLHRELTNIIQGCSTTVR